MNQTGSSPALVILGCGFVGEALAGRAVAAGRDVHVTTRQAGRVPELEALGCRVQLLSDESAWRALKASATGAECVVTYPPDPDTDTRAADLVRAARAAVYVSSTAVYGNTEGRIDDATPVSPDSPRAQRRLASEQVFRAAGATVLRAPGIYGPGRGVHRRLVAGTFRLVGDGSRYISRIHVDDLVGLIVSALERGEPGAAHAVGDEAASPQRTLVAFLCEALGLAMPASVPQEEVHDTLRGNRAIDPRPALAALGYTLRFPDFESGYTQVLRAEGLA